MEVCKTDFNSSLHGCYSYFKVVFTPLKYVPTIPPLSSYVINIYVFFSSFVTNIDGVRGMRRYCRNILQWSKTTLKVRITPMETTLRTDWLGREISIKGKVEYRWCSCLSTSSLAVGKEEVKSCVYLNSLVKSWLTTAKGIFFGTLSW